MLPIKLLGYVWVDVPLSKEYTDAAFDFKTAWLLFSVAKVTTAPVPLANPSFKCVNTAPNPFARYVLAAVSSFVNTSTAFNSGFTAWFQL